MKRTPKLHETLYDLNVGNAVGISGQTLREVIVTAVGKKYFKCVPRDSRFREETAYYINDWREKSEYCATHKLYETPQEWEDEKEAGKLRREIEETFKPGCGRDLPLDTLRAIHAHLPNVIICIFMFLCLTS
jgi:hypothetical protein